MLRSIASTPSAYRRNRKRATCRRGAGGAIARPAGSVLARADMGDETSQRGPFSAELSAPAALPPMRGVSGASNPVSVLRRTGCCRRRPPSSTAAGRGRCCGRSPPPRQRIGETEKEKPVGAAAVGPSHALLAPSSRARTWVTKQVNAGHFLLNYQRRRRCRQCGARAESATQSQCCGEPGAVEGDPLARQRPVEVDAAVDRLHPVSESAKHKKKNLSARRRWGHRTPCWLRPRARGHG